MAKQTNKPSAVVAQVGGNHYSVAHGTCPHCGGDIQHWDLYADAPYLEARSAGYLTRWREKGGLEDIRKAISFLEKRLKLEELRQSTGAVARPAPTGRR